MLFSNAIEENAIITIESNTLNSLNNDKLKKIKNKVPMRTNKLCRILHKELDALMFIEVMSTAKITKARI